MRRLASLLLLFPLVASAQVRTSDARVAVFGGVGYAYVPRIEAGAPSVGLEVATRRFGASAAVTIPTADVPRALGLTAVLYPTGRTARTSVALGAEFDLVRGSSSSSGTKVFLGPTATVSTRAVYTARGAVIPEVTAVALVPVSPGQSVQFGVAAAVTLATQSAVPGTWISVTPSVSRSIAVGAIDDRATTAVGLTLGLTSRR